MIAITGATGFLGSHLALTARAAGLAVRGVVRRAESPLLADAGVTLARGDLGEPDGLAEALAGADAVVANAALGSYEGDLDAFVRTNVGGTENTLRAAAAAGVRRVVLVSSVAIYRTVLRRPMNEDHPRYGPRRRAFSWTHLGTDWRYAVTKQAAEERAWALADELGLRLTVVRPGPIYGARDPKWTARLVRAARRPLAIVPTVGLPAVHAGDVARAVVAALGSPASVGRAYNLAGPPTPLATYVATMARLVGGGRVVRVPVPAWVAYDTDAARRDLGFAARPVEEGLAEAITDLRAPRR
jgi:dihydroflavonol-4-reductase